MSTTMTMSLVGDGDSSSPTGPPSWFLVVAIDCAQPRTRPLATSLAGVAEVEVGRGAERRAARSADRTRLRVDVPDGWMSTAHWKLSASGDGLTLQDTGSKNGTCLNGQRVRNAAVSDGDVVESGMTLFLVRFDPEGAGADQVPGDGRAMGAVQTLSPRFAHELRVLGRVARSTVPVLLLGETGTGKEVMARAVHEASARRGAFVAVNCGALADTLIESELFGARKGAFSGASEDRPGLVRAADGGTLFLDEIAELPEPSQAALLRVLQEGEVLPVGATQPVKVDLRVVAATHQDLAARVDEGRFRKDLYARLRGFTATLPPLRERREDIGLLVAYLLERLAPDRAELRLQRPAARALLTYDWPHNIRELELALRAALAVADGDELALEHLPEEVRSARASDSPRGSAALAGEDGRERFCELARQYRGNVSEIARALGTSRSQVRRLSQRFGVDLDSLRG